jgi:hypothetical protein
MHKKIVTVTCIVLLLCIVFLSGCEQKNITPGNQQPSDNLFIGDWKIIDSSPDNETWSFYTNGSAKNILTQVFEGVPMTTVSWFNYTQNDTSLCLSSMDTTPGSPDSYAQCFSSVFSENATHLTLSLQGNVVMVLTKIS